MKDRIGTSEQQAFLKSSDRGQIQSCQVNSGNFKRRGETLDLGMWTDGTNVLIAVEFGRETDGTASLFSVFFAFQCIACEQKWNEEKKKPNSKSDNA